jgi:hypothetical protein
MKAIKSTVLFVSVFIGTTLYAQDLFPNEPAISDSTKISRKQVLPRINFYVINKPKTFDLYTRLVIFRAKRRAAARKEKFIVIIASSTKHVKNQILQQLQARNAMIGSLWFDSHGRYQNGYSSFIIGNEEFSYKTIHDTSVTRNIRALAPYCDQFTKVAIGSCYGGATFEKPAHDGKPATRMNGDSLMIGLAHVLTDATIYGTEGWVMTKPGIFSKNGYALAGFPLQKRFKDEVYKPVWEHMGVWHSFSTTSNQFRTINTLGLSPTGAIHIKPQSYLDKEKYQKRQQRNLKKIKPGINKTA